MQLKTRLQIGFIVACILSPQDLWPAQDIPRAQEAESIRMKKSAEIRPERPKNMEGAMLWVQERKILEKLETPGAGYKGFRPRLGGFSTGSGFGFGFQYDRVQMLNGKANFSLTGAASLAAYQLYEAKLVLPGLAGGRIFLSSTARHRAMPQEDFFGVGPDSSENNRSSYLYEDTSIGVQAGVNPLRWLRAGVGVDWLQLNVGPGTDPRFASTDQIFSDTDTPGLDRQPDFLKQEWFAAIDTRDSAGNPHSGGFYGATFSRYDDRSFDLYDFHRIETEAQQYVPFNEGHRVIALRFHTSWDDPRTGNQVPFYLQKPLGGSNDLRGFREFRFRDRNQMLFNLEYRWEAWIGLDMALFGDAGKVFESREDFDLDNLETSYGLGFRFNTTKSVFWRIDIARSHEGTRAFIKFNHVF
jgi:outer membrane protein assembly factor BamA